MAEDIWGQIEKLKKVFQLLGLPIYQLSGFEADDLIGTIAKQAKCDAIIITGDRDLMQLVTKKIKLYMPVKGLSDTIIVDEEKVMERMGVHPNQIIDYKALVGDSSDNYPGVPGIGPKTAIQLIEQFGSFENIVKKSGNLKVANGYESGELSKRLATIKRDVPVTYEREKCPVPSTEKMAEVLAKLGYRSLTKRVDKTKVSDVNQVGLFD